MKSKQKGLPVLLTGTRVGSGEVGVVLTRWEMQFIRQLILDHVPVRGPKSQAVNELFGKTTAVDLFFQDKDARRRRRQKASLRRSSELESLEKMLGTGEQEIQS
ncbi:MAG: hypothetical protein FJZ38_21350 [Candidatus Rokubacteria bacterium]|nr:hypothetical protein [Candidatus Rokubacteria bacterium]